MSPNELEDKAMCCFLDADAAGILSREAEVAWFPRRRGWFEAGVELVREGAQVATAGWSRKYAERAGMPWHIAGQELAEILEFSVGCRENLRVYLELLRQASIDSRVRALHGAGMESDLNPTAVVEQLVKLEKDRVPAQPSATMRDLLPQVVGELDHPRDQRPLIPTGIDSLDSILGGGFASGVIVLGARTSIGKSALATNIASRSVLDGIPTLYVTLEMTPQSLVRRMVSHVSQVPISLPASEMNSAQLGSVRDSAGLLFAGGRLSFPVLDGRAWTPRWLDDQVERSRPLGLVVLDYLTLMTAKGDTRYEQLAVILASLRQLAARLDCPVLVLAQINRAPEARSDKRPQLSDLRDSGNIEEVADQVLLLHRDVTGRGDPHLATLVVAKNREGRTGTVRLEWRPETTSFIDGE